MVFEVNDGICTDTYTGHIPGTLLARSIFLCREGCNEEKSRASVVGLHSGKEGRVYAPRRKVATFPTEKEQ